MTSDRIANSALVSHFHFPPNQQHALLSRACLSALLQQDNSVDETEVHNFPPARYAAEHRVGRVVDQGVSLDIQNGTDYLFNENKPHPDAWIQLYLDKLDQHGTVRYCIHTASASVPLPAC